jgi:CelD/BcsL family acetyltransferase involved in cellulose biosynthesis
VSGQHVQLISSVAEFMTLRSAWNGLAASCPIGRVFSSFDWFDAAWQWRQQTSQLYLLCLFAGPTLIAVLPLVRENASMKGIGYRELSLMTVPDTQACDIIVAERDREVACEAFAAELNRRRSEWDIIRLQFLPPSAIARSAFRAALEAAGFATRLRPVTGNLFISLRSTWEEYYATRSRSLKKANNLAAGRMKKAGAVGIEWLAPGQGDASDRERFLDRAIAISALSWKTRTGNSLDNAGPQAFIRRLSQVAHERGWLSIWTLSVNDRPLAMEYQLIADGRVHALRSDFDAQFEPMSPGSHLNRSLLEQLFGRGLERYYMGPGDNSYKRRWTEEVETVEELCVYGRSARGRALALWQIAVRPIARKIRDRLRPAMNQGTKS